MKGDLIMDSNQNKEMYPREEAKEVKQMDSHENDKADLLAIISGKPVVPYIVINNHNPCFSREEKGELYSDENNLIKKAKSMNIENILPFIPFENLIHDYVKETQINVCYRMAPIYISSDDVAAGIQLEASSVEDNGATICFNVFLITAKIKLLWL